MKSWPFGFWGKKFLTPTSIFYPRNRVIKVLIFLKTKSLALKETVHLLLGYVRNIVPLKIAQNNNFPLAFIPIECLLLSL